MISWLEIRVSLDYGKMSAYIGSQGVTVYPIERGDIHTRDPSLHTLIEVSKGAQIQTEVMTAKQAVRALRKNPHYYIVTCESARSLQ